ncbi:hypothetical protein [Pelomonas sp. KK5]|uniref:hypothetical protein n=1 Tax=Pelomonas sp. KK5 TaxID=1855730 RepID=UPI001301D47C|nr:hypothetical protein [Pelomonas sp. KK5]
MMFHRPFRTLLLAVMAASLSPVAIGQEAAGSAQGQCRAVPRSFTLDQPQSVEELEANSLKDMAREPDRLPQVPFGFSNARWLDFKSKVMRGDEIRRFHDPGALGYVLLRGSCVLDIFVATVV